MKLSANLNNRMIVSLTPDGERLWNQYWGTSAQAGVPAAIRDAATLPDGRVTFLIWEAMHIFGPVCFNGSTQRPFKDNAVEIDTEV